MSINFNEKSANEGKLEDTTPPEKRKREDPVERELRTGERKRFVYKPNPMVDRAYQIFEYSPKKGTYNHVGDYVLVNKEEPRDITEKKMMNIMALLNKKGEMIDVSELTKIRILFTLVPEAQSPDQTKMIFKDYDGTGVSKDNAVFTIRKGVLT